MLPALLPIIGTLLDRFLPDPKQSEAAKLELMRMVQHGELAELQATTQLAAGQVSVNQQEAAGGGFAASWRPAVGWVCVFSLAYNYIVNPLLPWVMNACGYHVPPLPDLHNDELLTLVFGMLGLGGLRSYEKTRRVTAR
jgi:hypothetical protein